RSPGELAELEKKGDPDCPKGQGYEHPQSEKMIKCTGEQLAEMPEEKARSHFQKRGYKISDLGQSASKAEFGAHALEFHYKGRGGPSCLRITGRPGVPWQEIVARATGVHPDRIKKDETVPMRGHPLALTVQGDPAQWTVLLGECAL